MRISISSALLLVILNLSAALAQDIHFSQFHFTPVINNPANSGNQNTYRAIINYRNQWKSVSSPYKTGSATVDGPFGESLASESGRLGWGFNVFSDEAGQSEMATLQTSGSIAYHLNTGENAVLSAGLMVGYVSRSMNMANLTWGNQFDGYSYNSSLPDGEVKVSDKVSYVDLGAGLSYSYNRLWSMAIY